MTDYWAQFQEVKPKGGDYWSQFQTATNVNVSPDIKAKIDANIAAYEQRQEENRPWFDKNPAGRLGVAIAQGISNSAFNPAGYVARGMGIDTKPLKPENAIEKGAELAGEYGFDAAALGGIGKMAQGAGYLGKGQTLRSKVAQEVLAPENTTALLSKFVAPAVGGGLVEGITDPRNPFERTLANVAGAGIAGGLSGGFGRTRTSTKGALKEALPNDEANAALSKGVKADKEVARQISKDAPAVYNELNAEMSEALDKAVGRKLDYEQSIQNQKERLHKFIGANKDVELYSPKTAEQQAQENFNRCFDGSQVVDENGQPLKLYHGTDADFDAFDMSKGRSTMDIQGAFFSPYDLDARGYGSNLKEVYLNVKNPADEQTAYRALRKYQGQNDAGLKAKQDLQRQGFDGVFNGYDEYIAFEPNQIKSVNNSGAWSSSPSLSDAGWKAKPSLKDFMQGLNEFQEESFYKAIAEGKKHSTSAKGTLGATHKAQEVLNDMINASYDTSKNPFKPEPTTETRDLMAVKDRLNQILEIGGIKPYDESYSKAESLKSAFNRGYEFKPSETKFENLGLKTARDKRAFLQGRMAKIQDNVLSDGGTNLATAVKKDENTLRKLMPKSKFDDLMNKANSIEESFKRLKSIEGQADREIVKDIERGASPYRENTESKGSIIGRGLDILSNAINRSKNRNLANAYLNPEIDEIRQFGGLLGSLKGAGSASLRQALIDALN